MKMFLPIAFALAAATQPASNFARPTNEALQDSLNDLEVCRSLNPTECWWLKRAYTVHGASCIPIAPESGKPTIACRVDSTIAYEDPERGYTRDHDWCARFSKRGKLDDRPEWEVLQIRDRPCEIRSMLTSDPNPTPGKAPIERALVGMLKCYDLDGQTECGSQPESASVQAFQCMQIQPGEEYTVRVACRVTGDVRYSTGRLMSKFSHACIRFDRITPADRSPAIWVGIYVPEKSPCEVR